jgi:hypothetical protein
MSTEDRLRNLIGNAGMESRASEAEWDAFARKAHGALFTRRAAAALGAVTLIGVVVFAAVTLQSTDNAPIPPAPATSGSAEPEETVEPTPSPEPGISVEGEQELWYVEGEKLSWSSTSMGGEVPAGIADDDPSSQKAAYWLDILVAGVPGPVSETGGTTTIPEGTEVLGVSREGDQLFVDLSREFESGGGSLSMQMRLAQIVYTATQFPGIESARIMIEGEMVDAIGGEGVIVAEALTRRDFKDFAPNIVVEEPRSGQEFSPGDVVSGFANVFEANVNIRVVDVNGKVLGETFTTATCGTGCWGDFEHAMEFGVDSAQEGRVEVLTYSAEDGSEQDLISIPVMLVP